jgi:plastocyanin
MVRASIAPAFPSLCATAELGEGEVETLKPLPADHPAAEGAAAADDEDEDAEADADAEMGDAVEAEENAAGAGAGSGSAGAAGDAQMDTSAGDAGAKKKKNKKKKDKKKKKPETEVFRPTEHKVEAGETLDYDSTCVSLRWCAARLTRSCCAGLTRCTTL